MLRTIRTLVVPAALAMMLTLPLHAQVAGSLTADLVKDLSQVESKLVGLAKAMTADQYKWRPGEGVRSVGEVFLHVAADNYFLPAAMGMAAPASTGITGDEYTAVMAFEKQQLGRDAIIAELESSFAHLKKSLGEMPRERMRESVSVFGQDFTIREFMILATTHVHEHLGQMIAYARTNGVVPPWSAGGN